MSGTDLAVIETPAVVVDRAQTERNLVAMADLARGLGKALVPHTKTHKSPVWARRQLELGAPRVMVAKLSEAQALLAAGIQEQYIGYPLVDAIKERRLVELIEAGLHPVVAVDSDEGADLLVRVTERTGRPIAALVEVDTGFHRCGVESPDDVVRLARRLAQSPVDYAGITCFGGHINWRQPKDALPGLVDAEDAVLDRMAAVLTRAGLEPRIISEGGSIPAAFGDHLRTATEIRPGTYIYKDYCTMMCGAAQVEECSAYVLSTVVSTPSAERAVIDAGSKTLSGDGPADGSFGYIREHPELAIASVTEEHGVVMGRRGGRTGLRVGDRLSIIPNHVCTMMNLHGSFLLADSAQVVDEWPVVMRGAVR
ncbi:MAG: alanine racemase [Clostridia bacterium]